MLASLQLTCGQIVCRRRYGTRKKGICSVCKPVLSHKLNVYLLFTLFLVGSVSFPQFCSIMKREKRPTLDSLLGVFQKMDRNKDGFIDVKELRKILRKARDNSQPVDRIE